ncbi:CehA/McbA family metallohydrolase [Bacteroidota bacterium]
MTDFGNSRRNFLKVLSTSTVLSAATVPTISSCTSDTGTADRSEDGKSGKKKNKPDLYDGPTSTLFKAIKLAGNRKLSGLTASDVSERMAKAASSAPKGKGTAWGIPFNIGSDVIHLREEVHTTEISPINTNWLVFLHTSDRFEMSRNKDGFEVPPIKGVGKLNEHVADYIVIYEDDEEAIIPVHERHHVGMFQQSWGENCIQAVAYHKPHPIRQHHEQTTPGWGGSQTRVNTHDRGNWINWVYAWENPNPGKKIKGFRFEPQKKTSLVLSAISAGDVHSNPLRWDSRKKAALILPEGVGFIPELCNDGLLEQIQLDLGQVISASIRRKYPNDNWANSYNNKVPEHSYQEVIIEYAAHPEAQFHLFDKKKEYVSIVEKSRKLGVLRPIPPATQTVNLRVVEKGGNKPVPVKLHVHGQSDEYLAPVDRHRIPNNAWFEDYSSDFVHAGTHNCTYISGDTTIKLPFGKVYIEISKGFEIKPVRKIVEVDGSTKEITFEIEKMLNWREKGWVTADTHVHFLSPNTAWLEGSAEGVNVVNLLASQWGELMTNIGDFDGKSTFGSKEAGGDGEYLVRVGTENRQHVMGHISLLGYEGDIIVPMTTGGSDESAIGDPIEILLTEWALQCKKQNGLVILPHFPNPRLENAAAIVSGGIDGVEMTSWGDHYSGINPYSLSDWYRYLNCGYFVAAVGGTDKMSAGTAVGTVRTYAKIEKNREFTYDAWKEAVQVGNTFVTYGPLLNFTVDGKTMGSKIKMSASGGTVDVAWDVASITVPMSRVELVVNGEIRESVAVSKDKGQGNWSVKIDKSSWLALLVRGHYDDKPEIITAHSSPIMIEVQGSPMMAAADAFTILEQIEGALVYLDTIGTRAEDKVYKRLRMTLESAHRGLHNRMHQQGVFHQHTPIEDHPEHH